MVYTDYVTYFLEQTFIKINEKLFYKIKSIPKEELFHGLYELGIDFEVALIFNKYISMREAIGQNYDEALENLFPLLINTPFSDLVNRFQKELDIIVSFKLDS
jgi:hypothetical protein